MLSELFPNYQRKPDCFGDASENPYLAPIRIELYGSAKYVYTVHTHFNMAKYKLSRYSDYEIILAWMEKTLFA